MKVPIPHNESLRLEALRRYEVLDADSDATLDNFALLAAYVCQTPFASINFIDADWQWSKAQVGVAIPKTPRAASFCAHAILEADLLIVPDARTDARFAANPFVTGEPFIRFYAGAPLVTPHKFNLGTLCVLDVEPCRLDEEQAAALRLLSGQIISYVEQRREIASYKRAIEVFKRREKSLRDHLNNSMQKRLQDSAQGERRRFDPFDTIFMCDAVAK